MRERAGRENGGGGRRRGRDGRRKIEIGSAREKSMTDAGHVEQLRDLVGDAAVGFSWHDKVILSG